MITLWMPVHIDGARPTPMRLWLPLWLLWLLLFPLLAVLLPLMVIWCLVRRVNPGPLLGALIDVLRGLRGTHVEIQTGSASVLVRLV